MLKWFWTLALITTATTALPALAKLKEPVVTVYKSPTCGCCGNWEEHMCQAGFTVESKPTDDMNAIKAKYGVPEALRSCHTAVVNGYVVEGHVPAASVKKLLAEKPKETAGIAVPGMPTGSPGMEGPNPQSYDVKAFTKKGTASVFDHYK